jgi:hypothetical protein
MRDDRFGDALHVLSGHRFGCKARVELRAQGFSDQDVDVVQAGERLHTPGEIDGVADEVVVHALARANESGQTVSPTDVDAERQRSDMVCARSPLQSGIAVGMAGAVAAAVAKPKRLLDSSKARSETSGAR